VQAAINEFNQRQQQRLLQQQQAARFGRLDPRLTRYARRQRRDVDPNLQSHAALLADRDPGGGLTAQSQQTLTQVAMQHLQEQLRNVGDVTAPGVPPDRVRELMDQYPNPATGQTQFPELESYLDSGASGSNQINPADERVEQRDVGGTVVTIHSDRTDSLRDRRIDLLVQAIRTVQAAGYQVPPLTAHLPKYGRKLVVDQDQITPAAGAQSLYRAEYIAPDAVVTSPEGIGNPLDGQRYLSTQLGPDGVGTMVHEIGHFLHHHQNSDLFHDLLFTEFAAPAGPGAAAPGATAVSVSGYAGSNPREFVAEVFLGLVYGRTFSNEVMEMYDGLGGPAQNAAAGGPVSGTAP